MGEREMGVKSSTVYIVETNYPNADDTPEKRNTFVAYAASAFTHVDDPGYEASKMLVNTHKELFDKRVSRDIMAFDNVEDAKAVADFIMLYGRLCTGWAYNSQEQYKKKYRLPITARIVEEHNLCARRLIYFDPPAKLDPYELEFAALKKKYGKE